MRAVRIGLIQAKWDGDVEATIKKHEDMIDEAADKSVKVLCLQEYFYCPFFLAERDTKWHELAETVPGPLTGRMQKKAKEHNLVLIVPMYEKEMTGVYYNTAVVFDADGKMLGKYRKTHIPTREVFSEKFYFRPGNLGYPVFNTRYAKIGIFICYDRHFPEVARIYGLNGAEIVFIPAASTAGRWQDLWIVEQSAHAIANGYFVASVNRVGVEEPSEFADFFGSSCVINPSGNIIVKGSKDKDEVVIADIDLDMIEEARNKWSYYRDRRPETYNKLTEP